MPIGSLQAVPDSKRHAHTVYIKPFYFSNPLAIPGDCWATPRILQHAHLASLLCVATTQRRNKSCTEHSSCPGISALAGVYLASTPLIVFDNQ